MTSLTVTVNRAQVRAANVNWRAIGQWVARRLPLFALMAIPFLLGASLRLVVRGLARGVWAFGWLAAWVWFTAAEGWAAAAGRPG